MKTTIKLTDEQIETITKAEKEKLLKNFDIEVAKLKSKLDSDLAKLSSKYGNLTINIDDEIDEPKETIKFDYDLLKKLIDDGKTNKEIGVIMNYPNKTIGLRKNYLLNIKGKGKTESTKKVKK
ncbi:hypothetical protein HXX01_03470 [Candidatus Nomurabacteria bacterium]|nr:hypothetical protein [Candidatus Nomurabacteria bacterium]